MAAFSLHSLQTSQKVAKRTSGNLLATKMASVRAYLKPFRPFLIMIFLLVVGFLTYVTATDEPDDGVNDFAEFETEGDEEEEEETETHGTSDQDEDEEGLIKSK